MPFAIRILLEPADMFGAGAEGRVTKETSGGSCSAGVHTRAQQHGIEQGPAIVSGLLPTRWPLMSSRPEAGHKVKGLRRPFEVRLLSSRGNGVD